MTQGLRILEFLVYKRKKPLGILEFSSLLGSINLAQLANFIRATP
ncbi:MAG: hypothetical protein SPF98_02525 [Campylobacter sp.]|nr:hypothetical protein [Campylobacter sp.]